MTQHASTRTPRRKADSATCLQRIDRLWPRAQPLIMGILNRTPDSFADGGRNFDFDDSLQHAEEILVGGADIIDVGGESTRPGADPVSVAEELRRVVPVITEIRRRWPDTVISVDTSKVAVAEASLDAGADLVNDVTAASADAMLELVAGSNAGIVLMHMRGKPRTMQSNTAYANVVAEVHEHLRNRAAAAIAAGIPAQRVWLDPGIGFGKDDDGNLALLAALPELAVMGHPVLVGPSRKSFIGRITGAEVGDRIPGTLAAIMPAVGIDRAVVRVHDAAAAFQFLEIASRLHEASA